MCALFCSGAATSHGQTVGRSEAGAQILRPIMIMGWEELNFGKIIADTDAAGQIDVTSSGIRSCSIATCFDDIFSAGRFMVTGEADKAYIITLPTSLTLVNQQNDQMAVSGFEATKTQGVLVEGTDEFFLGAELTVNPNQSLGLYTGTFLVTVEYQ